MGLFSDKCPALIDPSTKRALSGDALQKARLNPESPRCGHSVKKKAKFCSRCGYSATGGWFKCTNCSNWVGSESNFCWNCKAALHPDSRGDVAGGIWQKPAEVFAQRFEVGDIKQLLTRGIQVQAGTAAILLEGGVVKEVIGPGRYDVENLAQKLSLWGAKPPRTIILIESGDVVLPMRTKALRSADDIQVEFYAEVCFRFVGANAGRFVENLFKTRDQLSYSEIMDALEMEIRYAVENLCNTSTIEDLVKDPQRRLQLEASLQDTLKVSLDRFGMEIVRVQTVDFDGPAYEALRMKSGETELKRRSLEFDQRLQELLVSDKMQQFKTQQDLEQYVLQLAQEKGVTAEHREQELGRLRQVHRHELDASSLVFRMEQERKHSEHLLEVEYNRHVNELRKKKDTWELEKEQTEQALLWKEKKDQAKVRARREMMEAVRGASVKDLLASTEDPGEREALLAYEDLMIKKDLTPQQVLAMNSAKNPAAAEAFGRMSEIDQKAIRELLEEKKKALDESRDRDERLLGKAMEAISNGIKSAGPTHIIK
ncbi:MAG: SPFH domain-containing protein [bacterium]